MSGQEERSGQQNLGNLLASQKEKARTKPIDTELRFVLRICQNPYLGPLAFVLSII